MAWPSGTKASTANVDAGTDLLSLARPDIKQNIDNVNTIIDEFNIASPSNGNLLQYSTSSGKWEPVTASSVGTQVDFLKLEANNLTQGNYTNLTNVIQATELSDSGGIATVTGDSGSDYALQLVSGKYIVGIHYETVQNLAGGFTLRFRNEPDSVLDLYTLAVTNSDDALTQQVRYLDTDIHGLDFIFELDYNNNVVTDGRLVCYLQITKIA